MVELTTALVSEETIMRPRYYSTSDQVVTWVICVLALISNSLTIVTILKTRHGIGQKVRLYILNISVADIFIVPTLIIELTLSKTGYLFQPLFDLDDDVMTEIYQRERFSNILVGYLYYFPMCTSLMTLFAVAVDRLLAVGRPVWYRTSVTQFRIKLMLGGIWVYAAFSGAWFFIYTGLQVSPAQMLASFNPVDFIPPFVNDYMLMPNIYIAVLGNSIAYFLAYRQLKRSGRVQASTLATGSGSDQLAERTLQRNRRFFRMAVATVFTQITLWTPFGITYVVLPLNRRNSPEYMYDYVQPFVYSITISNSWINPFLYSALNKDYRRAYLRVLRSMVAATNAVAPENWDSART